jgi:hypothetical protein
MVNQSDGKQETGGSGSARGGSNTGTGKGGLSLFKSNVQLL